MKAWMILGGSILIVAAALLGRGSGTEGNAPLRHSVAGVTAPNSVVTAPHDGVHPIERARANDAPVLGDRETGLMSGAGGLGLPNGDAESSSPAAEALLLQMLSDGSGTLFFDPRSSDGAFSVLNPFGVSPTKQSTDDFHLREGHVFCTYVTFEPVTPVLPLTEEGYLSEGVRAELCHAPTGRRWSASRRRYWARRALQGFLEANPGFAVSRTARVRVSGRVGRRVTLYGMNPHLGQLERVDLVVVGNRLTLAEVEIVSPAATWNDQLADAIVASLDLPRGRVASSPVDGGTI